MTSVIVKEREAGHRSTIVSVREYWKGRLLRLDTGVRQRPGLGLGLPQIEAAGCFTVSVLFTIIPCAGAEGDSC